MQLQSLFDPASAAIVVGGTILATVLRCGLADARLSVRALLALARPRFQSVPVRAQLAAHVRDMRQDGVIRAEPVTIGDAEIDEATSALIASRSLEGLHHAHAVHKRTRVEASSRAVRTFGQAAELSPVFGLAGTLVSLSQLPGLSADGGDFTGAIGMAVLTTLYGILLGNLLLTPLGRMIARRAAEEEHARQDVFDWLEAQVTHALPPARRDGDDAPGPAHRPARAAA